MTRRGVRAVLAAAIGALAVAGAAVYEVGRIHGAGSTAAAPAGETSTRTREFWDLYGRAGTERTAGHLDAAARLYRQALVLRPEHEDSLYYLGSCLREGGSYDEAMQIYRQLIERNPKGSSRSYMQLAAIRASLEPGAPVDLAEADTLYTRALQIDPDSGALLGLAEVALLQHRLTDAERLLQSVDVDNPISVAAPYLRGYLAFERGEAGTAWTHFSTAVARGGVQKGGVKWTEEGDLKASPELRWRALARQSVFGASWLRLRAYLPPPGPTRADMRSEYRRLHDEVIRRWH